MLNRTNQKGIKTREERKPVPSPLSSCCVQTHVDTVCVARAQLPAAAAASAGFSCRRISDPSAALHHALLSYFPVASFLLFLTCCATPVQPLFTPFFLPLLPASCCSFFVVSFLSNFLLYIFMTVRPAIRHALVTDATSWMGIFSLFRCSLRIASDGITALDTSAATNGKKV